MDNYKLLSFRKKSKLNSSPIPKSHGWREKFYGSLFLIILILFGFKANAQAVTSYIFTATTGTYTQVGGTATQLAGVQADSSISANQNIGFTFNYAGANYTQFKMSSNGFISLNSTGGSNLGTNDFSAANSTTRPIIAPLWDDLDGRATGGSFAGYELSGVSPNRVLTVEWRNWEWNWNSASPVISFQVKLYETSNNIEFIYRSESGAVNSGSASIGIGAPTGSGANSYLSLSSIATPAVSSTTSTNSLSTKPATGTVYRFSIPPPCSGTPAPGNTIASSAAVGTGSTVNLSLQNATTGLGVTYQWQSGPSSSGPWTNISGATNATAAPTVNAVTWYQCLVTCSGNTGTSNPVQVGLTYCTPIYTNGKTDGDLISNISISGTTLSNNTGTSPVNPAYTYFTGAPNLTGTLQAGSTYSVNVTVGNWGNQYIRAWIDYNDNFVFEANELIGNTVIGLGIGNNVSILPPASFPITLSCNPPLGTHRMRVRSVWSTTAITVDPCASAGYGETEDYDVTITAPVPCPAPSALTSSVNGTNYDLNWTIGCAETAWEVVVQPNGTGIPTGSGVSVTSKPYVVASSSLPAGPQEFYVRAICGGANGNSSWVGPFLFTAPGCSTLVSPTNGQANVVLVDGGVPVQWSASPGATSYDVFGGTTSGSLALLGNIATTQVSITGIGFGTTYFWRIVPKNAIGNAVGCSEWSFTVQAAPADDLCSGATSLDTLTSPITASTNSYANNFTPSCGSSTHSAPDRFYSITVPPGYTLNIRNTVSSFDNANTLFYGSCAAPIAISCSDTDTLLRTWENTTGSTQTAYWVQDGWGTGSGSFTLEWSLVPPPVVVSSFSPNFVCGQAGGTQVVITGSNFTGATAVQFNGIAATSFVINSDTQITAVVPAGNIAGPVSVASAPSSNGTGASTTSMAVNSIPVVSPITGSSNDLCMPNILELENSTALGVWSTSNPSIATVNAGDVTGVAEGTAVISYTVTDNGCSTAVTYTVNVKAPVNISTQPSNQSVLTGSNTSFAVVATGTGLTYSWEESTDGGTSFNPISNGGVYSGADTSTLSLTSVPETMNGNLYQCVVSGASPCAPSTSLSVVLVVGNTGIATQPSNVSLCNTGNATFTVVASGDVTSYQWYQDAGSGPELLVNSTNVSGATSDTLTLTGVDTSYNGYTYYVEIVGPTNTVTSNNGTLFVNTPASIDVNPASQTVCYSGGTATFTSTAGGTFTGVQWQYSSDNISWNNVVNATPVGVTYNGATTTSLTVTTTAATPILGTYYYRMVAIASSPCSSVESASAQLLFNNPSITSAPSNATVLAGNTATFTVASTATGTVTYQWQRATTVNGTYQNVANNTPSNITYNGANTATLSVITANGASTGTNNFYRVIVASDGCAVTSTGASLTVNNYCQPTTTTGGATDSVTNVVITNVDQSTNVTQASTASSPWFTLYNNTPLNVLQGQNMSVSITFGSDGTQFSAVWVDYNRDGLFSDSENVALASASAGGGATVTYNFTVPVTSSTGITRIRVRGGSDSAYTAAGSCTSSSYGETEDYFINILAAPSCSGTPAVPTAASSVSVACANSPINLTLTGIPAELGYTYQWFSRTLPSGSFEAISGATSSSYAYTIPASSEIYAVITCSNSGLSTNSNTITVTTSLCNYTVTRNTGITYNSIMTTGSTYTTLLGNASSTPITDGDDGRTNVVSLAGTTFRYNGAAVTGFYATTNGWMTFNTAQTSAQWTNDLTSTNQNNVLAPFWEDLVIKGNLTASRDISMRYQIMVLQVVLLPIRIQ